MLDLMVQTLDLPLEQSKILSNQLLQHISFLIVGSDKIISNFPHIIEGINIMHLFALLVMLDTALCLAYRTSTRTGDAAADLNRPQRVQLTKDTLFRLHLI